MNQMGIVEFDQKLKKGGLKGLSSSYFEFKFKRLC
jgi:hypothetical protein